MSRIGVFICHCGENIGRTVDCVKVAESAGQFNGVVHAVEYKYMCSDPGQLMIKEAIKAHKLTGVVVGACSPRMHEPTFRRACAEAGLNPFLCEMANLREHVSWVHEDREKATAKAIDHVRIIVEKVKRNQKLFPIKVPVTRRALVIGGGIAGIQTALDIANGGAEVVLVERSPSIGGHMAQLSETFPTLDCSQCILTPRMVDVAVHPRITLHTYSEVEEVKGYIGNFEIKIKKKARSVDMKACTGCGSCYQKCPVKKIPSEFDAQLGVRTAIYVPFPQAVPNRPVIDRTKCIQFLKGKCGSCKKVCPKNAINYEEQDSYVTEKVGAIVVATGYEPFDCTPYKEFGYGKHKDIITSLQFERLASASGPTSGAIKRPSDGKEPQKIVFLQCIGSRDPQKGLEYCSKICCMYTAKHTMLYKHKVHHGTAYVFYMDTRCGGKRYEEFLRRAIEEDDAKYIRGRVSRIYEKKGKLYVMGGDTLTGKQVVIDADMVVLAAAMVPQKDIESLAQKLSIGYDKDRFLLEAHPKLRPVETNTAGIMLAGSCMGPMDIPEAVAQGSASAAKVLGLFSGPELEREPVVARVNELTCAHCRYCINACPYKAITDKEIRDKAGKLLKTVAEVNPSVCQGCGVCNALCPSKSVELDGFTDQQMYAAIAAMEG
ncbi:MAG: CoB--CoM heterodisulfide reductase iron-sulfur subunit A family protein [Planctomycetota bacterium]|nr:CoB--CoM heterodisulfide reductase iron-sulfur subunit A family protein [Planctomycetota bacterium]